MSERVTGYSSQRVRLRILTSLEFSWSSPVTMKVILEPGEVPDVDDDAGVCACARPTSTEDTKIRKRLRQRFVWLLLDQEVMRRQHTGVVLTHTGARMLISQQASLFFESFRQAAPCENTLARACLLFFESFRQATPCGRGLAPGHCT